MSDWNHDLNPVPKEAEVYLKHVGVHIQTKGNPVEDLTGIMIDCFELLATMSKSYTPTGNSSHDNSVNRITALMEQWQASEIEVLKTNAELDRRKPSHAPPPPPGNIVFEDPDANKQSIIDEKLAALDVNASGGNDKSSPKTVKPVAAATRTATRNSKNDDYFIKLKEDEALAKKKQEEEEAKLKPEQRLKLQEERRAAEQHEKSKTNHLSSLGSKYMPAKKKTSTGEIVLERGGGGRGRGRGRGGGGH
mmetsp:Transcript_17869/g.29880  ORF Transcript_17869/g.29880 Transcript_17869/m.29880 type:complete len:249 (+) Transcript_17869:193-939(+)